MPKITDPMALQQLNGGQQGLSTGGAMPPVMTNPIRQQQMQRTDQMMGLDANQDARAAQSLALQQQSAALAQERESREAAEAQRKNAERQLTGGVDTTEAEKTAAYLTTRLQKSAGVISQILKENPDAKQPGWGETIAGVFGPRARDLALPEKTKSARQQLNNTYDDVIDAALTLSTGAAYTKEQAENFKERFKPSVTDTPETIVFKGKQLLSEIAAGRAKSGAGNIAIDQAMRAIEGIYGIDNAGTQEQSKLSTTDKAVPIPTEMQKELDQFFSQHPPGTLKLEDYVAARNAITQKYSFGDDKDPDNAGFVKAYNAGQASTKLPTASRPLTQLESGVAKIAGSDAGVGAANFANAMSFGGPELLAGKEGRTGFQTANAESPKSALLGEVLGSVGPTVGLEKAALSALPAVSSRGKIGVEALVNALYGAERGAAGAEDGSRGQAALGGGITGAVGSVAGNAVTKGIPAFLSPEKQAALELTKNIDKTTLQRMGVGRSEETFSSVPGVHGARQKAQESFNIDNANRALANIGEKLPANTQPGTSANAQMNGLISKAYDKIRPQIVGKPDPTFIAKTKELASKAKSPLEQQLYNEINSLKTTLFDKKGTYNGTSFKDVDQRLRSLSSDWLGVEAGSTPSTSTYHRMGRLAEDFRKELRELAGRNTPAVKKDLDNVDRAWAHSKRIEDATNRAVASNEGVYSPGNYLTSIKKLDPSPDKAATARGRAFDQEYGEAAAKILGASQPGKSTPYSTLLPTAAAGSYFAPWLTGGVAAGAVSAYGPGVKRITQAVTSGKRPAMLDNDLVNALVAQSMRSKLEGR